jgi:hypothetical protein
MGGEDQGRGRRAQGVARHHPEGHPRYPMPHEQGRREARDHGALFGGHLFYNGGGMRFFRKKPEPADPFAAFSEKFNVRVPKAERPEPEAEPNPELVEVGTWAHQRLGVAADASPKEISAAYRRLARRFHPDKVANLDIEARIHSEQRMKEINIAYAELKGSIVPTRARHSGVSQRRLNCRCSRGTVP